MSKPDLQRRSIRALRASRATFLAAAVLGVLFASVLAAYSLGAAFAMAVPVAILLTFAVVQTSTIRRWKAEERAARLELAARAGGAARQGAGTMAGFGLGMARLTAALGPCAHPDAEPVDLSTGERVAWVCANPECGAELPAGWTPPAQVTGTLTASGGAFSVTAALSGTGSLSARGRRVACDCGKSAEEHAREWDEQVIASQGIPPARMATDAELHFEALARVGRDHCTGFCPICAERDHPGGGSGRVTVVYHSGTADGAMTAGGGGGTSESAWQPEPPEGAYDYHFDSAGREWCRDADDLCWTKPAASGPWYRQNKTGRE